MSQCEVYVSQRPHHTHYIRCQKRATTERAGVKCCGTHARQADKWEKQGRMEAMVDFWWRER